MSETEYDVAIAGLGVHGAAAASALARRGARVLGLDARRPPHTHGSSHGRTRIIREAYFEHPLYVPLVQRAAAGWRRLEADTGRSLLRVTGGLNVGRADGALVRGTLASCETHGLAHERLDADAIRSRFPALAPRAADAAILEPGAGVLFTEPCVQALLDAARAAGATLRTDEALLEWQPHGAAVTLVTARRTYEAGALVLALGAWLPEQLGSLHVPLEIERQTHHWFEARVDHAAGRCPIVLWESEPEGIFWAIPDVGHGVKAGIHHGGQRAPSADAVVRAVSPDDEERIRALLGRCLPTVGRVLGGAVCLYTNTPDRHFVIDVHPRHANVVIASACSGHGFKFAPALAELVADLAQACPPPADLEPFRLARFDV
jgi:sarcosine oxidase